MKKLRFTFEVLTVALLVLLGVLSDLNKLDVPYYVFLALGGVYIMLCAKGWSDKNVTDLVQSIGGENPPPDDEEDDNNPPGGGRNARRKKK